MMVRILTYFLIYSFLGWIVDTAYRSLPLWTYAPGTLVPFLGIIYGTAAFAILLSSRHLKGKNILVEFVAYVLIATAIEYAGGWIGLWWTGRMLWDYSYDPYNFHGFIGLYTSLGWGLLSLLLVYRIHPFVTRVYDKVISR